MKKEKSFNWWYLPAILCGIVAAFTIVLYVITVNMVLVLAILPSIAGTAFCLYRITGSKVVQKSVGLSLTGPIIGETNALCIYGKVVNSERLAEKVQFEKREEKDLLGDRWFFEDLNAWKHVLFNDIDGDGSMKAFELPDTAYTDPARLSIQLNMGRVNELFQTDLSLFDQLKPWIIAVCITVVGFLIFLSGS